MAELNKDTLTKNAIDWNRREFYRAVNEERWSDAARLKGNIERLLEGGREGEVS